MTDGGTSVSTRRAKRGSTIPVRFRLYDCDGVEVSTDLGLGVLRRAQDSLGRSKMLGVESTPTWFVRYPDGTVATATAQGVFGLLSEEQLRLHAR